MEDNSFAPLNKSLNAQTSCGNQSLEGGEIKLSHHQQQETPDEQELTEKRNTEILETDGSRYDNAKEEPLDFLDLPWEDVLFRYILPCLPLQTQFQMRGVSQGFLELMTEYFRAAKSVNICRVAFRMTSAAFEILTRENVSLQSLVLRNAKDWLSNELLKPVLKQSVKLQKLDLTNCLSVNNACIQVAAMNCKHLKVLSLRECHWISKEAITVIALNCKELEQLDITGCWEVNDEAVILVALQCKKLWYLSLARIYGLTDYALTVIAREGVSIKHLNIQGCWRLSDDSIRILAEYCHSLQALQVRECRDVTEKSLAKLRLKNVKIDVRPPPNMRNLSQLSGNLRARLNVQI